MIRAGDKKKTYRNSRTLDASVGHGTMDPGLWTLDSGRWTLEAGLWMLGSGSWTFSAELWKLDSGHWTLPLTVSEQNRNPVSDST